MADLEQQLFGAMAAAEEATEAAWLEWRRGGIGASEISAVAGRNPWDSPLSVYLRKRGEIPDPVTTEAMWLGKLLEPACEEIFHRRTQLYVIGAQTMCQHPEHEWARATVDGFVVESIHSERGDALGVFEAKTGGDISRFDPLPDHVNYQCQWQMFVTEEARAWVAVLAGGRSLTGEVIEVARDDDTIEGLHKAGAEFWRRVQEGDPPPVEGFSPGDRDALATAYPEPEPGSVLELGDRGAELVAHLRALKEVATVNAEQITATENEIKSLLGDNEAGAVDGELAVTWRATDTTRVDVTRLRASAPDLAREFSITTTSRRFLVRPGADRD